MLAVCQIDIADNKCIVTNYLVKPAGIDDWLPAMGYNGNYPITSKLQRGETIKGTWKIEYRTGTKDIFDEYSFNFLLLKKDLKHEDVTIDKMRIFQKKKVEYIYLNISRSEIEKYFF